MEGRGRNIKTKQNSSSRIPCLPTYISMSCYVSSCHTIPSFIPTYHLPSIMLCIYMYVCTKQGGFIFIYFIYSDGASGRLAGQSFSRSVGRAVGRAGGRADDADALRTLRCVCAYLCMYVSFYFYFLSLMFGWLNFWRHILFSLEELKEGKRTRPSVYLSIYLSIYLSTYISIDLNIYTYAYINSRLLYILALSSKVLQVL